MTLNIDNLCEKIHALRKLHALDEFVLSYRIRFPDIKLTVIHVDHQLQSDSSTWASFCHNLCIDNNVVYQCLPVQVLDSKRKGLEAAARDARYTAFTNVMRAKKHACLLLAHHANDQVETVFMRLIQGTGIHGLCGIHETTNRDGYLIFRPLLQFSKYELENLCENLNQPHCIDYSNTSQKMTRNHLRHKLIPLLEQKWPACIDTISKQVMVCQEEVQGFSDVLSFQYMSLKGSYAGLDYLPTDSFNQLTRQNRLVLLRWLFIKSGFYSPSHKRLQCFLSQLNAYQSDSAISLITKQCRLEVDRGRIFFFSNIFYKCTKDQSFEIVKKDGLLIVRSSLVDFIFRPYIDKASHSLDDVAILFVDGHYGKKLLQKSKKTKNIYQELDMPKFLRPFYPWLLIRGEYKCYAQKSTSSNSLFNVDINWKQ